MHRFVRSLEPCIYSQTEWSNTHEQTLMLYYVLKVRSFFTSAIKAEEKLTTDH